MFRPRETRFASAQGGGFCYTSAEILLCSYPGEVDVRRKETRCASAHGGRVCNTCTEILTFVLP